MSVKINSFGGPVTWFFRKHCSNLTSKLALSFAASRYNRRVKKYIRYFESQKDIPVFMNLMIETINRCNGSCAFCPASKDSETRPFKRMNEKMYRSIIEELRNQEWKGKLFLNINNEPFVDVRILKFAEYAKDTIPGGGICGAGYKWDVAFAEENV